jgi:hypothetical protein
VVKAEESATEILRYHCVLDKAAECGMSFNSLSGRIIVDVRTEAIGKRTFPKKNAEMRRPERRYVSRLLSHVQLFYEFGGSRKVWRLAALEMVKDPFEMKRFFRE